MTDSLLARMTALRRALHRHPELSGKEHHTAQTIIDHLDAAGLPWYRLGETGVICDLPGRAEGPRVALRADTDALPITEQTGLSFASTRPGRMHACGHDGHTGILFGAALRLAAKPPPGPIRCIWQPAEEAAVGALRMIEAGALQGVGMIFGGHIDPRYPSGDLIVTDGAVNASADHLSITVRGQQGHGARPHETHDAIVAASQLVIALQTIVSREISPGTPAVISIGAFHAGDSHNIISGDARLDGTIRSLCPKMRQQLADAIERVAAGIALAQQVSISVSIERGSPPLLNQGAAVRLAREAAIAVAGAERVGALAELNLGGEDFSEYLQHVAGCYIRFGAARPGACFEPAHSSRFDFDEAAMANASAWMVEVARRASVVLVG